MITKKYAAMAASLTTIFLGGCGHLQTNQQASLFETNVEPVVTEYSRALSCLGDLIDDSNAPPLTVFVQRINDETVPERFENRRLSHGGAWWFHTAIAKIESSRITSSTKAPSRSNELKGKLLILSGAWIQDDLEVGRNQQNAEWNNTGSGILALLGFSRNKETAVIAGDFLSSVNGQVVHASAISVAVSGSRQGFELRIDDGPRSLDVGIASDVNEGPQFAQRRITEAAAMVHIAKAFNIDYRDCIRENWANPDEHRKQLKAFLDAPKHVQNRKTQQALVKAGYQPGEIDGKWGHQSKKALLAFQSSQGLAPTGVPSVQLYTLLLTNHTARE